MKTLIVAFMALALIFGVGTVAWATPIEAVDSHIESMANHDFYLIGLTGKLLDGADTIAGGPLEMIEHPYKDVIVGKDYVKGIFTGVGKGLYHSLETIADGTRRVIEAPLPK